MNEIFHTFFLYQITNLIIAHNGGVPRHLAMSIGFEYPQYPDAISKMIKDEQIKVTGCTVASLLIGARRR
jgi:hypothetical protein